MLKLLLTVLIYVSDSCEMYLSLADTYTHECM